MSTCPDGQVLRSPLCVLLTLGLALPARAAPTTPLEPAPLSVEVATPADPPAVTSTTAEVPLSERQAEARRVFR
ncbi:MAG: hypothetical protein JNK56_36155, partial [Myxococcales bacterium]|nr:hypothetical protein [Myxococcales bacterium]